MCVHGVLTSMHSPLAGKMSLPFLCYIHARLGQVDKIAHVCQESHGKSFASLVERVCFAGERLWFRTVIVGNRR